MSSSSSTSMLVASGIAVTAAVTGAALMAVGVTSGTPAPAATTGQFPRYTPLTAQETEESLKLDWVPPKGKTLRLRQTRANAAKALHDAIIAKNMKQGAADQKARADRVQRCRETLARFKSEKELSKEHPKGKWCSSCEQRIQGKFYPQNGYNICGDCSRCCFACSSEFGDKQRYTLPLAKIEGKQSGQRTAGKVPEAFLCGDCVHFLQYRSCSNCQRSITKSYDGKCRECSSHICVGCEEIISTSKFVAKHADNEDMVEYWCETCFDQVKLNDLRCHCCRRQDFSLHGKLQLRPLHQSAVEICPNGDYSRDAAVGRLVCHDCAHPDQQLVVTKAQAQKLWLEEVIPYFASKDIEIPGDALQKVKILLVDSAEMDRLANSVVCGSGEGAHHRGSSTLGLTLSSTVTHTVRTVAMKNGKLVHTDRHLDDRKPTVHTHEHSVDAIALLYGLPLVASGEVLAHEFVHAFHVLYEGRADPHDEAKQMTKKVSEGTAQLASFLWLRDCVQNPRFRTLKVMRLRNIEKHSEPDYREGFLEAKAAFDKITARRLLVFSGAPFNRLFQHVAETGKFP